MISTTGSLRSLDSNSAINQSEFAQPSLEMPIEGVTEGSGHNLKSPNANQIHKQCAQKLLAKDFDEEPINM